MAGGWTCWLMRHVLLRSSCPFSCITSMEQGTGVARMFGTDQITKRGVRWEAVLEPG